MQRKIRLLLNYVGLKYTRSWIFAWTLACIKPASFTDIIKPMLQGQIEVDLNKHCLNIAFKLQAFKQKNMLTYKFQIFSIDWVI